VICFQVLSKGKYLCLSDYDETYFDFHCTKEKLVDGERWYTICGTPYENHMEYIVIICTVCFLGLSWCLNMLQTGELPGSHRHHKPHLKQN